MFHIFFYFADAKGLDDLRVSSLNIVLKDYNNESLARAQTVSQSRSIKLKAQMEGIELEAVTLMTDPTCNPDNISTLCLTKRIDGIVAKELREAVKMLAPLISMNLVDKSDPGITICFFKNYVLSNTRLL